MPGKCLTMHRAQVKQLPRAEMGQTNYRRAALAVLLGGNGGIVAIAPGQRQRGDHLGAYRRRGCVLGSALLHAAQTDAPLCVRS
jgi:hypothetical protein